MQIQKIHNNPSFNALSIKKVDIDHVKKFIDPVKDSLGCLSRECDICISDTTIPIAQKGNAIIGDSALKITVRPLVEDRFLYSLSHLFLSKPQSITAVIPIDKLEGSGKTKIIHTIGQAVEDMYGPATSRVIRQ